MLGGRRSGVPRAPADRRRGVVGRRLSVLLLLASVLLVRSPAAAEAEPAPPSLTARELVAAAIDQTRGRSSRAELEMEVHRPDWQRSSSIVAWTRGREDALIRFTAPPRDAGNATLKAGEQMWTFTPRLNRVVRLPYSMLSQSWAGSDFSYNDLSRTDALLKYYRHELVDVRADGEHLIYTIDSVPDADAPVVWGRQRLVLRDDYVLLEQTFHDQDDLPVKRMETREIGELGGRLVPRVLRMQRLDEPDHWTEVRYADAAFDIEIPDRRFTLFALRDGDGRP